MSYIRTAGHIVHHLCDSEVGGVDAGGGGTIVSGWDRTRNERDEGEGDETKKSALVSFSFLFEDEEEEGESMGVGMEEEERERGGGWREKSRTYWQTNFPS